MLSKLEISSLRWITIQVLSGLVLTVRHIIIMYFPPVHAQMHDYVFPSIIVGERLVLNYVGESGDRKFYGTGDNMMC